MKESPRYEFRGKRLTAGEIAAETGLTKNLISDRLFRGLRGEALTEPPLSRSEAAKRAKHTMHGGTACTPKRTKQARQK